MNLNRYLDRVLPAEKEEAIRNHLLGCEACRLEYEELEQLVQQMDLELQQMIFDEPQSLSDDFTAQVLQRVETEYSSGQSWVWPWRRWFRHRYVSLSYAAMATLVVISAGNPFFLWNEGMNRMATWGAQLQTGINVTGAYAAVPVHLLDSLWQGLRSLVILN